MDKLRYGNYFLENSSTDGATLFPIGLSWAGTGLTVERSVSVLQRFWDEFPEHCLKKTKTCEYLPQSHFHKAVHFMLTNYS